MRRLFPVLLLAALPVWAADNDRQPLPAIPPPPPGMEAFDAALEPQVTIVKSEKDFVSQPNELAQGKTEKVHRTEIGVNEGEGALKYIPRQVSVAELAKALNAMGLSARDLITIFEMLHEAGALQAQIKTM